MSKPESSLTRRLRGASPFWFACYAIAASFSTYFCMYAFRKPFAAATFDGYGTLRGVDFKTVYVISQIVGYALSKFIGIKVCSEVARQRRAGMLVCLILAAQTALIFFGLLPRLWKPAAIFANGLALGMVWGMVVRYLEGRRLSELLLAGLSCSYIVSSGVVKDVGRVWLAWGITDAWMPAVVGCCFLPLFCLAVWFLNQLPPPTPADVASRVERPEMDGAARLAFVLRFAPGLAMLLLTYFLVTAYRDFRDNYGIEVLGSLGYADVRGVFSAAGIPIALAVLLAVASINGLRDHRVGLIATYCVMVGGLTTMAVATIALDLGWMRGRELWWMVLVGLGAYLIYVPYGTALMERLIASTGARATVVFWIYVADAVGYTGSISIQLFKDLGRSEMSRLDFFRGLTYCVAGLGAVLLVTSCCYFLANARREPILEHAADPRPPRDATMGRNPAGKRDEDF